jgi:hypothetical protein
MTLSLLGISAQKRGLSSDKLSMDDAMLRRIKYVVTVERRPFSYKDLIDLMKYGTIRNKISRLRREGVIERVTNSQIGFYTLTGYPFDRRGLMTDNHMGISSVIPVTGVIPYTAVYEADNFFDYLKTLDTTANSIHDIHTKFAVPDIYRIMSSNPKYSSLINPVSLDVPLEAENIDDMHIHIAVHRTDTVTVIVGCSRKPITLDERGITRLSCALTRIEERLSQKLNECGVLQGAAESIAIPDNQRWQVTMWHFGKDKFANEYPAKGYALTWGHGREVLRTYIKRLNSKNVERKERQEYPKKPLENALDEKMTQVSTYGGQ